MQWFGYLTMSTKEHDIGRMKEKTLSVPSGVFYPPKRHFPALYTGKIECEVEEQATLSSSNSLYLPEMTHIMQIPTKCAKYQLQIFSYHKRMWKIFLYGKSHCCLSNIPKMFHWSLWWKILPLTPRDKIFQQIFRISLANHNALNIHRTFNQFI